MVWLRAQGRNRGVYIKDIHIAWASSCERATGVSRRYLSGKDIGNADCSILGAIEDILKVLLRYEPKGWLIICWLETEPSEKLDMEYWRL